MKVKEREIIKDNKIDYVVEIRKALMQLKQLREMRLGEISGIFGLDSLSDYEKMSTVEGLQKENLSNAFEELLRIKEKDEILEKN